MRDRRFRTLLIAVFALSVLLRIVLITEATPALVSDARDYHVYAHNLMAGNGYRQTYHGETQAYEGFTFRAYRPPGYPIFLAALYKTFGWHPRIALAANAAAELITQLCFTAIAALFFGANAALAVSALLAVHVLWTPSLMTESLYTALLAVLALGLASRVPFRSVAGAAATGVVAMAALFVRPVTICFFPAVVAQGAAVRPRLRALLCLVLVFLPSLAGLSVWTARNYRLFGVVVPFATNLGHHNAYEYRFDRDAIFTVLRRQGLNEARINNAFLRLEWDKARSHPGPWLRLWAARIAGLFSLRPAWELTAVIWPRVYGGESAGGIRRLHRMLYRQYYGTYPLAAAGALALVVLGRSLGGLWTLMLAYVIIQAVFSRGDIRLGAPLYPFMCLLAAGGCRELLLWLRRSRGRSTP